MCRADRNWKIKSIHYFGDEMDASTFTGANITMLPLTPTITVGTGVKKADGTPMASSYLIRFTTDDTLPGGACAPPSSATGCDRIY